MGWKESKDAGNKAYTAGDTNEAIAQYTAALQADDVPQTDRATILCNRAQAYLKIGDNSNAIEDCTACLTFSPDNVKALFRRFVAPQVLYFALLTSTILTVARYSCRATALEATGEVKDALRDYKRAVELSPGLPDAVSGVTRCETTLGIRPAARKGAPSSSSRGGGSSSGVQPTLSAEDQRHFQELQERVREVAVAKMRASEQLRNATSEKRKADLTISQVTPLAAERPLFTALGRMFVRAPREEVLQQVQVAAAQAEKKADVCKKTLSHLESQEKEADVAFTEFVGSLGRKMGGAPMRVTAA